ncbi:hypothetical protein GCM10027321_14200 [Massilia terrae]
MPLCVLRRAFRQFHLDEAVYRHRIEAQIAVESGSLEFLRNFVLREPAVTFLPFNGVPRADERLRAVPVSAQDLDPLKVVLGQLKGRQLSIAAEKFAEQLSGHLPELP